MSIRELWDVRRELNAYSQSNNSLRGQINVYKRAISRIGDERREERALFEAEIERLNQLVSSHEHRLNGLSSKLSQEQRNSASYRSQADNFARQVNAFKSGNYVSSFVSAAARVERENPAQLPLITTAAMRFNSYYDEFLPKIELHQAERLIVLGWFAFPSKYFSDQGGADANLPYVFPGQGLSSSYEQFETAGLTTSAVSLSRLNAIFYTALAIAVMNSTTLIDVATGVFNERFDGAAQNGDDVSHLCQAYNDATKVWRSYASRQAGDIRNLVWPIMNQIVYMANAYPGRFWGYGDTEINRGDYEVPVELINCFQDSIAGYKSSDFMPRTKMQDFITYYGSGTKALEGAYEQGLLDIKLIWNDRVEGLFGRSKGFEKVSLPSSSGFTQQIKSIIKRM